MDGKGERALLDKVMPQDTGWIFEYANVHGDVCGLIFDGWAEVAFL